MLNKSSLTGRLTKDVELKYTSNGVPVGTFTLAVARNYTNEKGEKETDFINCVVWRRQAETMAQYLNKGNLIGVSGRLQTRSYENEQGMRIFLTELVVEEFTFLETKKEETQQQTKSQYRKYVK